MTSIIRQLIDNHLIAGLPTAGEMISLRPDQALLQDTNGPTSFLQFEAPGSHRSPSPTGAQGTRSR